MNDFNISKEPVDDIGAAMKFKNPLSLRMGDFVLSISIEAAPVADKDNESNQTEDAGE